MVFSKGKYRTVNRNHSSRSSRKPFKRYAYITAGIISLVLAFVGIPVPMLPTTPFLLLSVWFFMRSSPTLLRWLLYHPFFGKYIRDYREKKGIPLKIKVSALLLLWTTILLSVFWVVHWIWVKTLLILIAAGVTLHIINLKTLR